MRLKLGGTPRRVGALLLVMMLLASMNLGVSYAAPSAARQLTGEYSTSSAYAESTGEYLVVYQNYNGFALASAISGQFVDTEGKLIGGSFTIATISQNMPENPYVVYNPNKDEFLVVWNDGISTARRIYGVILDINGQKVSDIMELDTPPGGWESHDTPRAAYNWADDTYLIVWNFRNEFEVQLHGIMVGSDLMEAQELTFGPYPSDADSFDLVYNPSEDNFTVAVEFGGSSPVILALEVDGDGTVSMLDSVVPGLTKLSQPRIVHNEMVEDDFVIMRHDTGSKFSLVGKYRGGDAPLVEFTSNLLNEPNTLDVAVNPHTGEMLVVWTESAGDEGTVYAQSLTADGELIDAEPVMLEGETGYMTDLSVEFNDEMLEFVVTFIQNSKLDNPVLDTTIYPLDEAFNMEGVSEVESNNNVKELSTNLTKSLTDSTAKLETEEAEKNFKILETNLNNIETEAILVPALENYIETADALSKAVVDPANVKFVEDKLVDMAGVMAKSAQKIEDTKVLAGVTTKFLENVTKVQTAGVEKSVEMNVTVSDFAQSVIDKIGEVKPEAQTEVVENKAKVKFDPVSLETQLADKVEAFNTVTGAFDNYYGTENVRDFQFKVTLATDRVAEEVTVPIDKGLVDKLKTANVEALGVKVGGTQLTVDSTVFAETVNDETELLVDMSFADQTFAEPQQELTFKSGYTTNVEVVVDGVEQKVLEEPVDLAFDLDQFEFFDEQFNPSLVSVFRLNEATGQWEPVGGVYDPVTNTVATKRISLSQYTVMQANKSFSDVEESWAKAEINELLGKGILDDEATFNPEDAVTREEFTTWVTRAYGLTNETATAPFEDIPADSAHLTEIASAYDKGIISGSSPTTFNPDGNITKEQMMVILSNAMVAYDDKKLNAELTAGLTEYRDSDLVAGWATDEVALMIELGIITIGERGIGPQETITKEQAVAIIKKIYG